MASQASLCENKNVSQRALKSGPQPFGSNTLLSELQRRVLFWRSKIYTWSCSIGSN